MRWIFIIAASFFFYGWWDWRFLFLILFSGMVDYWAARAIDRYPLHKRKWLVLSVIANLGCLAVFKYSRFFAQNIDAVFSAMSLPVRLTPEISPFFSAAPVGISFYTFQSLSYTIDVYRGQFRPTRNIFHFFAYLSMFPQLVAGPIVRARALLPQLAQRHTKISSDDYWRGLQLVVLGYFKKVVIADNLAPMVNEAFGRPAIETSSIFWWIVVTMFALQIYCDFSGYSDIARGLARWMGFRFPRNFIHPYASRSLREFWQRWHISLSTWFRDYVYLPLGGSRTGRYKTYRNLWITMMLSGLWHGAAWTFLAWSAVHSLFLCVERLTRWPAKLSRVTGGPVVLIGATLVQVWIGWVFFRAQSLGQALEILKQMFFFNTNTFVPVDAVLFMKATLLAGGWLAVEMVAGNNLHTKVKIPAAFMTRVSQIGLAAMIAACIYLRGPGSAFIYFQF